MLAPLLLVSALNLGAAPDPLAAPRAEAEALVLIQQTLQWYTATVGETSIQAETYLGHDRLFSKETIARFRKAAKEPGISADERRAREYFQAYLANEYLSQSTSKYDDRAQNAALQATVRLPWMKDPVPYKQLDLIVADEKDAGRRAEIEKARSEIQKTVLNPILAEKEAMAQKLARELGYRSYVELSEESRRAQLRPFMVEGKRFLDATDAMFKELLAEVTQRELGIPAAQLRRSDFNRLFKAPRHERFFPADIAVPSFKAFLAGMGIDFKTVAGTEVRVDDAVNPLKEPRAACWGIRVPSDVRINVKPIPGVDIDGTFFVLAGLAV